MSDDQAAPDYSRKASDGGEPSLEALAEAAAANADEPAKRKPRDADADLVRPEHMANGHGGMLGGLTAADAIG